MRAATAKWPYSGKDELNCLWARADVQATMMGRRGKREPVVLDMVRKAAAGSCGGVVAAANVFVCSRGPTGSVPLSWPVY
jgi:hypothetical protein